ncbi:hypothetical protein [Streptococcus suis]|uniref:hypothetical protein n=1 Tax=Streptococcus suis TaxID=1307 RepID=UPI001650F54A|nr:hypothetical protein [Streptococcus suis]MBL6538747.1 hypothetical protein [Streptococcus suis]MBM7191190.1 hypothetical protein [Streptococcus suis]MBM7270653.1 hypothetical protein [Streptococcus suis]MCO8223438.1 hypothetical protein [Streptococcus suis]HEM3471318.1 hypothetical protein [Streptococcus suis]
MAKKYKVQQYFDTYPDGHWLFDTEDEAISFYEKKQRSLRGRYKVDIQYVGEVETEES